MVKLELLPRKEFQLTFEGDYASIGSVRGKFGTYALQLLCDKLKCRLFELKDKFDPKERNEKGEIVLNEKGDPISLPAEIEVYMEFLLCAVRSVAEETGKPFSYTRANAGSWIDAMGGKDSPMMLEIVQHSGDNVKSPEKKTEEKVA